jgi:hypothetical protein
VTNITVVHSLLLLRVRAAETGPLRHFAAAHQMEANGGRADIRLIRVSLLISAKGRRRGVSAAIIYKIVVAVTQNISVVKGVQSNFITRNGRPC